MTLFLALYSLSLSAKLETEYRWVKSSKSFLTGTCYEIDKVTQGKKYQASVDVKYCIPKNTAYFFLPKEGKCYEVDIETNGENFTYKSDIENCRPDQVEKKFTRIFGKDGCFEIDKQTGGKKYYRFIQSNKCEANSNEYLFKLSKNHQGDCFVKSNEQLVKVKNSFCRPNTPIYKYYRKSAFQGICFEQDPRGESFYSRKTKIENCRPKKTVYVFYKDPKNPKSSKCYELDELTKGDQYLNVVSKKNCK